MRGVYRCKLAPTSISVQADLLEIIPPSAFAFEVLSFGVFQTNRKGDAQEEEIQISFIRGFTTSGSGGTTAAAPDKTDARDAASSCTFEAGNTTLATTGTTEEPFSTGWNVRGALERVFTPEERIRCDSGQTRLVMRMGAAPSVAMTIGAYALIREL